MSAAVTVDVDRSHGFPVPPHALQIESSNFCLAFAIVASVFASAPNGEQGPVALPLLTVSQHFWIALDSAAKRAAALLPIVTWHLLSAFCALSLGFVVFKLAYEMA